MNATFVDGYSDTPTRLPPPVRKVSMRTYSMTIWIPRLLTLPVLLFGVAVAALPVLYAICALAGVQDGALSAWLGLPSGLVSSADDAINLAGFALVVNLILQIPSWGLWVTPLRERWLYRHGIATTGKVKGFRSGKAAEYVTFSYPHPVDGREVSGMQILGGEPGETFRAGDEVTVLYHPRRPERGVTYELGMYRVRGEKRYKG